MYHAQHVTATACTWFIETAFVHDVSMCVCVYLPPRLVITSHMK